MSKGKKFSIFVGILLVFLYIKGYGLYLNKYSLPMIGNYSMFSFGISGGGSREEPSIARFSIEKRDEGWLIKPRNIYLQVPRKDQITGVELAYKNKQELINQGDTLFIEDDIIHFAEPLETAKRTFQTSQMPFPTSHPDYYTLTFKLKNEENLIYHIFEEDECFYVQQPYGRIYRINKAFYEELTKIIEPY